jgi:hypothetical protein
MINEPTRLMAHVAPPGVLALPKASDCLAHRCADHRGWRMHNAQGPQGSECGACIMADVVALDGLLLDVLDGYAMRLTHHRMILNKLRQARERLNMMAPGAGDWLDADVAEHEATGQ